MDAEFFLNYPDTEFAKPLSTPDQGLQIRDTDGRFNDFVPLDGLTIGQVNAQLQQSVGNAAELHKNLSVDASFQNILSSLNAKLIFAPDGQSLRVEALGGVTAATAAATKATARVLDWLPVLPSNLPSYQSPPATQEPPVIFAPPPPSSRSFFVPGIPPTETFISQIDLGTYGMQTVLFYQQEIIQFADLIAGHLDYSTIDPVLKTGFEDLIRLSNKLEQSNQQFISTFKDTGTPAPTQPGQTVTYTFANEGQLVDLTPAERESARRLKGLTLALNNPNQALSMYREERLREGRERSIQLEWESLLVKLQTLYFASNISAAINYCLDIVAKETRGLERSSLLDTIIRSDARDPFAALVAAYVKNNRVRTPNSYHTGIQYREFDERYHASIRNLSRCTFKPSEPAFIKMLRLKSY